MAREASAPVAQPGQGHGWTGLAGIGVWVLYCPSQLNIMWDNGSNLIVRFDAATIITQFEPDSDAEVVRLPFTVRMGTPRGVNGVLSAVLRFPATMTSRVQRLAETLQAAAPAHGDGLPAGVGQPARPPATTPDAPAATPDAPVTTPDAPVTTPDAPAATPDAPAATPDAPAPTSVPVRIDASPRYWTDDPDWVGLYPPGETEYLLLVPADRQDQSTEHSQAT